MSDTTRTGTEQLLLSAAIDRAINQMNLEPLAGKEVFLDGQYLKGVTDEQYIVSTLRQHLLAHGCVLKEKREDAAYVVEARAGAVGTNRNEVLIGVPSVNIPNFGLVPGVPSSIPEIPFAKSTEQKGLAKIAVYAYNRETGLAVWQSGAFPVATNSKDTWILGSGPFQRGSIYDGTRFAGSRIMTPFRRDPGDDMHATGHGAKIPVTAEAVFEERPLVARPPGGGLTDGSRDGRTDKGGDVRPTAALESAPPETFLPSGRIVRLPPVDHDIARETQWPVQTDHDAVADTSSRSRLSGQAAAPAAQQGGFSLLKPGTWFGTRK